MPKFINKFIVVSALSAAFATGAIYVFQAFGQGKFDPLWVGGAAAGLAFIFGYMMDAKVES